MRRSALGMLITVFALCDLLLGNTPDNNPDSTELLDTVEGDILLTKQQLEAYLHTYRPADSARPPRAVIMVEKKKWPLGVVPYDLSPELSNTAHNIIMSAMEQYMADTCITFRRKEAADYDHLYFYPGGGCMSYVGRLGGQQNISIGPMCEHKGVVMHEIFHALGRWHEHSRPDRDNYIQVNDSNIKPGKENNFHKVNNSLSTTQDIAYDYYSIMHYDAYAFTRNGEPTLQPLDKGIPLTHIGQRDSFSEQDLRHIQTLYCDGLTNQWSSWSVWSSCSTTCGPGSRYRTRTCLVEVGCLGNAESTETCNQGDCPVVSVWSDWSSWSGCSRTCGRGQRTRVRMCMGGDDCEGENQEFQECNKQPCPEGWGPWGEWGACSRTCQGGVATRVRTCLNSEGGCQGTDKEQVPCNVNISCPEPTIQPPECPEQAICSSTSLAQNISLLLFALSIAWLCTHT